MGIWCDKIDYKYKHQYFIEQNKRNKHIEPYIIKIYLPKHAQVKVEIKE